MAAPKLTGRERVIKEHSDPDGNLSWFGRMLLAAFELVDVESEDDHAWDRAKQRFMEAAASCREGPRRLGEARWKDVSKEDRAIAMSATAKKRWEKTSPEKRSATMRKVVQARWARARSK